MRQLSGISASSAPFLLLLRWYLAARYSLCLKIALPALTQPPTASATTPHATRLPHLQLPQGRAG